MPLAACERAVATNGPIAAGAVMPAPLPPYALAAFAPLAALPFPVAQCVFDLLSLGALVLSVILLRRLTGLPLVPITYALAPLAWIVVALGQTVLLLTAALVATAFLLQRRRDALAGLVGSTMMLEPHLGLPLCAALVLARPQTRIAVLASGVAMAAVSTLVLPPHLAIEYVRDVVPLHALSEARGAAQISFTALLTFLRVPDRLAIAIGGLQYLVTAALAIVLARRAGTGPELVFIAVLGGLFGGTFLHNEDLLLAVPAALVLWKRGAAIVAFVLIALSPHVPGVGGVVAPWLSVLSAAIVITSIWSRLHAVVTAFALAAYLMLHPEHASSSGRAVLQAVAPQAFAQESWSRWEALNVRDDRWILGAVPSWAGLLVLFAAYGRATIASRTYRRA
jgi:hypothetical protein